MYVSCPSLSGYLSFLSDVLLSYAFTIFEAVQLRNGETVFHDQARTTHLDGGPGFWLYILQVSKLGDVLVSLPDSHQNRVWERDGAMTLCILCSQDCPSHFCLVALVHTFLYSK